MRTSRLLMTLLLLSLSLVAAPAAAQARTFYVNPVTGNDAVFQGGAQNPATPVKTVKRALTWAIGGDTVLVVVPSAPSPVTLADTVTIESKRDGAAGTPIVIRCQVAGLCVFQPPAGTNGFFISHNDHVVDGFKVTNANMGIRVGAHDAGDGPLFRGVVQNNIVQNSVSNGIQCANCQGVEIAFNSVTGSGQNGIRYQGNASLIHDNTANGNDQFGIYVVDGIDHQVWANAASGNGQGQIQILGTLLLQQRTYYVSAAGGDDSRTPEQAQSDVTPWHTIQKGLNVALAGDTIVVLPGTYAGAESKTDATAAFPIVLRSSIPGGATIQAGAGINGLVIGHHYHTVDGFVVAGSANGLQFGPHEVGDGPVSGPVAVNNIVHGNTAAGIKFSKAQGGAAMHNVVYGNGQEGILYGGQNGNILNNLVYGNGAPGSGKYGLTLGSGSGHKVTNNTVHGNGVGGLRLGTSNSVPVFSTVYNNIVTNNPIGVKEPGGLSYTGLATLDFNNVQGNGTNYQLGPSPVGANSVSLPPGYVNAGALDFRLGRVATGHPADSACIDRGSASADAVGLGGRTAFTDKSPDTGLKVDLGYHGTLLKPSQGAVTVGGITMHFLQAVGGDDVSITARLTQGGDSDGIGLGTDFVQLGIGATVFSLSVASLTETVPNTTWKAYGPAPITEATFTRNGDAVDVALSASGLNLAFAEGPLSVQITIGDDSGSAIVPMRGTLVYP